MFDKHKRNSIKYAHDLGAMKQHLLEQEQLLKILDSCDTVEEARKMLLTFKKASSDVVTNLRKKYNASFFEAYGDVRSKVIL